MRGRQLLSLLLFAPAFHCASPTPAPAPAPEIIESHPGSLVITSPRRAAFLEASATDPGDPSDHTVGADEIVEVSGTGATHALLVNGAPADVDADGAFRAKIHPSAGLNVIVALDGDARLETPFLYGHFVAPTKSIAHAIAIDLGSRGITGVAPDASIESVTNLALAGRDLIGSFKGKTFSGEMSAASWSFEVTGGKNGATKVVFGSALEGVAVNATVEDVVVEGRLSITSLGLTYARDVRITVARGNVIGDVEISVDEDRGTVGAAMPAAAVKLDGFAFDTDNAGFPCCVDSILSGYVRPKIEDAIREGIRTKVPDAVQLSLEGLGVPRKIDFAAAGFSVNMPLVTRFDGGLFDRNGGTITASTLFGEEPKANTPGATAPGWLALGHPYGGVDTRAPVLGVSISIDALNQLMYAAWAGGSLSYTAPAPLNATLAPALPPIVSISGEGVVRVGLGEIVVQRPGSEHALAAVTVLQDVAPSGDADALVLTPKGEPTISVTWLADDSAGSGLNLVAQAARDQLGKFLKPFAFPLPKLPLSALGPGLAGQSLAVRSPTITVDPKSGRIRAAGIFKLVK